MVISLTEILTIKTGFLPIPILEGSVPAGFPSPAGDYLEPTINLEDFVTDHPNATYCVKVTGDSMNGIGISSGDMLIIDKALGAVSGDIVVAVLNGDFTVKEFQKSGTTISLIPHNPKFKKIIISEGDHLEIWGVVTVAIKDFKKRSVHGRNR